MIDFYSCANCGRQYSVEYALQNGKHLFCGYKCLTLWRAGVASPREKEEAKNEDAEFARIAQLARKIC